MKILLRAQSTLELIMVIILVLAGILVMGPYVIRGVNAYMHSWELSVDQANSNPNVALDPSEVPGGSVSPPPPVACSSLDGTECLNNPDCMWVTEYACPHCGEPGEQCDYDNSYCADTNSVTCSYYSSGDCCIQDGPCLTYGNPCGLQYIP